MFILASASPRRKELLEQIGCSFRIEVSDAEEAGGRGMTPSELVMKNAHLKAAAVAARYPDIPVLGADTVVKGLRAITDFEYEFQMAALNYQIDQEIETVFIMSAPGNMYLSSSVVREIARFGGDTSPFVTPCVDRALKGKFDA